MREELCFNKMTGKSTIIYKSLAQVWDVLGTHSNAPQVKNLAALCLARGLMDKDSALRMANTVRDHPFIVIEGLDGCGKTTLTNFLSNTVGMKLIATPPKIPEFQQSRPYFDGQSESLRRAYYSLGNYVAAQDVIDSKQPVVMDRFWHSTAAYAMANTIKSDSTVKFPAEDYMWPEDLLKPDLVIFLQVSEEERIKRHTNRADFTNTAEEQTLATSADYRKSLMEIYRSISGPRFFELNVDGEKPDSQAKMLKTVCEYFPSLAQRDTEEQKQKQ